MADSCEIVEDVVENLKSLGLSYWDFTKTVIKGKSLNEHEIIIKMFELFGSALFSTTNPEEDGSPKYEKGSILFAISSKKSQIKTTIKIPKDMVITSFNNSNF